MRFETSKTTPPHLDRRLQLRMLGFVGLIGVIMFVMSTFQNNPKRKLKDKPLPGAPDPSVFQVDERNGLKDGEFVSTPGDERGTRHGKHREPVWQEPPAVDGVPSDTREGLEQEIARLETEFDRDTLRRVKDNTIGILSGEADPYYHLLDHARRVRAVDLEKAGATDVLYINLMEQPDRFRGEAITIRGDLWRLYEFPAGPNDRGLKTCYEAWIFTADSDKHPYRVVFTHLPPELQPGENLRKPVKVTGFFFKREGYASKGGMHVAPLLLANRVMPFRPPEAIPEAGAIVPYMMVIIAAIGMAFIVTLVSFAISDRRAAQAALARDMNVPRPSFEGIDVGPILSVKDQLQQMEDEIWESSVEAEARSGDVSAALHARDKTTKDGSERANNRV